MIKFNNDYKIRSNLWIDIINENGIENIAEVGVYKGEFSERLLRNCLNIEKYYMIDPWRKLDDWNKPANDSDYRFHKFYEEALRRTDFASEKRQVLRGKTIEVSDRIKDCSLDLVYIDGDHTLRGIVVDILRLWPKLKKDGYVGGDDCTPTIWQHGYEFEPTFVFPFIIHFAEAVDRKVYILPLNQFLILKENPGFEIINLTGGSDYSDTTLLRMIDEGRKFSLIEYGRRILRKVMY